MSDDWKTPALCACGADATPGLASCAPCRAERLWRAHFPADASPWRPPPDVAPLVEKSLRDARAHLDAALAQRAQHAGHAAVGWAARHGGHVRTFAASPAPDGALAGSAVCIPTIEVRRG